MSELAQILAKVDELSDKVDMLIHSPFIKTKKKYTPQSGRHDYLMGYKNSKGEYSEREINISKVTTNKDGKAVINAFCFSSQANKTFSVGSIAYLQSLPDGEKLQTYDEIIAELSGWL